MIETEQRISRTTQAESTRFRLIKRILKYVPRRAMLHKYPILKYFADWARKRHYLWSFRDADVKPALYIGFILSLSPLYGVQIPVAILFSLIFRCNLMIMVALQMITNPVTIIPIYTLCYEVGHHAFNLIGFHVETFSLSEVYAAITGNAMGEDTRRVIKIIFQKTLFGGVILGSICGLLSSLFYTTITRKFLFPKKAKPEDELNQTL